MKVISAKEYFNKLMTGEYIMFLPEGFDTTNPSKENFVGLMKKGDIDVRYYMSIFDMDKTNREKIINLAMEYGLINV